MRCRVWYRALDAAMTAGLHRLRPGQHRRAVLSPSSSFFVRVAALVAGIDSHFPGAARRAHKLLLRPSRLPFRLDRMRLVGVGSGSSVYLLETGGARVVLKVYRRTIGKSLETLLDLAATYQRKFDTVSSWYSGPHPIVAPATFVVIQGPLLGLPAVACLQHYIEGEKLDPFLDLEDSDLQRLFRDNTKLRAEFLYFARRTVETSLVQGSCVDLLGSQNLALVRDGESWALKLIDYGIFNLRTLEGESPAAFSRITTILSRFQEMVGPGQGGAL